MMLFPDRVQNAACAVDICDGCGQGKVDVEVFTVRTLMRKTPTWYPRVLPLSCFAEEHAIIGAIDGRIRRSRD